MPGKISNLLNHTVRNDFSAAQMNGAQLPFIAVTVNTFGQKSLLISSMQAGILCFNAADYASVAGVVVMLQRGLMPDTAIAWNSQEVAEENIFYDIIRNRATNDFRELYNFPSPISLEQGYNYTLMIGVIPSAAFAGIVRFWGGVYGNTFDPNQQQFPYFLR